MREILFRGKSKNDTYKKDGEWVVSSFIMHDPEQSLLSNEIELFEYSRWVAIDPETVSQYTGLTDKNGKKIFEGDIIKGAWNKVFQVVYDECYLGFRAELKTGFRNSIDYYGLNKIEVIGNIHDNPELLKGE